MELCPLTWKVIESAKRFFGPSYSVAMESSCSMNQNSFNELGKSLVNGSWFIEQAHATLVYLSVVVDLQWLVGMPSVKFLRW